jgi:hypothetical protein
MKMIKRYLFVMLLALGALMFAACGTDSDGGSAEIPEPDDGLISVRYKMNGGVTNALGNTSDVVIRGVTPGTPFIDLPDKPMPSWITLDKTFAAWNTQSDGNGTYYYPETPVEAPEGTKELVLYAVYAADIISNFASEVVCNDPNVIYTISDDAILGATIPVCTFPGQAFMGKFFGNGHKISYSQSTETNAGLFGHLDGAILSDLTVEFTGASLDGTETAGILAGTAKDSVIRNISVSGRLIGYGADAVMGGVVGRLDNSTVSGAFSSVDFGTISSTFPMVMGGIAGYLGEGSVITDSAHQAVVKLTTGNDHILGGIAGINDGGTIKSCYSNSILSSTSTSIIAGGIVGDLRSGTVKDSIAFGTMINAAAAGRIAGNIEPGASVENSYAKGDMLINYKVAADSEKDGEKLDIASALKSQAFFRDTLNYDFNAIWIMPEYYDFPAFLWQQNDLPAYTEITSATELQGISGDGLYILFNDIDLSRLNASEANEGAWTQISTFSGILDGNGHTISNLKMSGTGNLSMFGTVSGTIKNIRFDDVSITPVIGSYNTMAALAQSLTAAGVIESVRVSGDIIGGNNIGGLVVTNSGIISHSSFNGTVAADYTEGAGYVGGIASTAAAGSYILFSSSAGSREYLVLPAATRVMAKYLGGFAGQATGTIISSYSTADFYSEGSNVYMGGIAGQLANGATFLDTYATGNASSRTVPLGSSASATSATTYFGGLLGYANLNSSARITVRNSFADARSAVLTLNTEWVPDPSTTPTPLTTLNLNAGGMWGSRGSLGAYDYLNTFSNNDLTRATIDGSMAAAGSNTEAEQLPTLNSDFYQTTLGWDFDTVWKMPEGGTYPILQWEN